MPQCSFDQPNRSRVAVARSGVAVASAPEPIWTPEGGFKTETEIRTGVRRELDAMLDCLNISQITHVVTVREGGLAVLDPLVMALLGVRHFVPKMSTCVISEYDLNLGYTHPVHDAHFVEQPHWYATQLDTDPYGWLFMVDDVGYTLKTARCFCRGVSEEIGAWALKHVAILTLVNRWGFQELVQVGIPGENFWCVWDIPVSPRHVVHVNHPVYHPHSQYGQFCVSIDHC